MKGIVVGFCGLVLQTSAQFNFQINGGGLRFGILNSEIVNIGGRNKDRQFANSFPGKVNIPMPGMPTMPTLPNIPSLNIPNFSLPSVSLPPIPPPQPQPQPQPIVKPEIKIDPVHESQAKTIQNNKPQIKTETIKQNKQKLPSIQLQTPTLIHNHMGEQNDFMHQNMMGSVGFQPYILTPNQVSQNYEIKTVQNTKTLQVNMKLNEQKSIINQTKQKNQEQEQIIIVDQNMKQSIKPNVQIQPVRQISKPTYRTQNNVNVFVVDMSENKQSGDDQQSIRSQQQRKKYEQIKKKQQERLSRFVSMMPESQKQHLRAIATEKIQN